MSVLTVDHVAVGYTNTVIIEELSAAIPEKNYDHYWSKWMW